MSRLISTQLLAIFIGSAVLVLSNQYGGRSGLVIALVPTVALWLLLAIYGQKRENDLLRPAKRSLKCSHCDYPQDLQSDSPHCPECGASVSEFVASVRQTRRDREPPEHGSVFR